MTDHNLLADLARAIWDQPEAAFRTDAPAETPDEVFATREPEPEPERKAARFYVQPADEALRDLRAAAARAKAAGATEREVIAFLLLGYRGLMLPGADERRLVSILAAIWADADDQRDGAA